MDNNPLTERTALVTGGGSGIGAAIAVALAKQGCRVAIAGRRSKPLQETAESYDGEPKILTHTVDVAVRRDVDALCDRATIELGRENFRVDGRLDHRPRPGKRQQLLGTASSALGPEPGPCPTRHNHGM